MTMTLLQGPTAAPLALAEVRAFLRLDHEDDDALLSAFIETARQACEDFTGRSLITQRWRLTRPIPADRRLRLTRGPVQSVDDVQLVTRDTATPVASAQYLLDRASEPPQLRFDGLAWSGSPPANLQVDYTTGYGDDWNSVPMGLRQGMLRLVAYQYRVRDGDGAAALPSAVAALWAPFRVMQL